MREITVKDLAELLGVSKPTIQRAINAAAIEASREDKQTRYYSLDAAAAITAKVKPDFDFWACVGRSETPPHDAAQTETPPQNAATPAENAENDAAHTETEPKQTETPPQTAESMEFMKAMLATIQEQLAAKDKQIAAYEAQIAFQNEQIKDYSERLREAMELTKGQQYIAAADKTAGLLEAAAANKEESEIVIEDPAAGDDIPDPAAPAAAPAKRSLLKWLFGKE